MQDENMELKKVFEGKKKKGVGWCGTVCRDQVTDYLRKSLAF